ncbi:ABC transporter permease [Micromonospora sp. KC207]|uniref:ABC transporter permease subunit n=1 Tax=Micromonospora sp. KC207 TaxID=2530377 RepID=UPI0010517A5E|nr:ABC transporter permease subunit [Micromonospora sp. KC207]TDC58889.1 ABC transporter permease [Micromonospora sp. KC207]
MSTVDTPQASTLWHAMRSEWTKIRTLRSAWYTLIAAVVLGIGLGWVITFADARAYVDFSAEDQAAWDPAGRSLSGAIMAQLAIGLLGALVLTSEYATGMIRTSMAVVPRRGRLLAAKTVVFTGIALIAGELIGFVSFFTGQAILRGQNVPYADLGQPQVLRAVIGCGLYLATVGLLGVAVGVLVRATAGAIAIVTALTFLLPAFIPALPESLARFMGTYWPSMAARELMLVHHEPGVLSPWSGFGLLLGSVVVVFAAAYVVFRRRDA